MSARVNERANVFDSASSGLAHNVYPGISVLISAGSEINGIFYIAGNSEDV